MSYADMYRGALKEIAARDAEIAALRKENADLRESFDTTIRFAESLGIHGSESVSEAFAVLCHRWEDAARDAGELRADLASLRLRYREAVEAHQKIVDHDIVYADTTPEQSLEFQSCEDCKRAREAKWPPSGQCDKHYNMFASIRHENEVRKRYEHLDMRAISRSVLSTPEAIAIIKEGQS